MTDEQCPACGSTKRDGEKPDPDVGLQGWCICADCGLEVESKGWENVRRLRELAREVRWILMPMDVGNETHWYLRGYIKRAKRDAIGRLLEGER